MTLELGAGLLGLLTVNLFARVDDLFIPVALGAILGVLGRRQGRNASVGRVDRSPRGLLRLKFIAQIIPGYPAKRALLFLDDAWGANSRT